MLRHAIILAAGCGSRLRPYLADELPKGAVSIQGTPILERSIQQLIHMGIDHIFIGTGHGASWIEALAKRYPQVTCIPNHEFSRSGSMHTLSLIIPRVQQDALLLESDLLYDARCLRFLMDCPDPNAILATPFYNYGDEVFIDVNDNNALTAMSKIPQKNREDWQVLSGISKCSVELLRAMHTTYTQQPSQQVDYEDMLVAVGKRMPIYVHCNPSVHAMEIDTHDHYKIAKELWPAIQQHDATRHHERTILLNPGPATLSDRVKMAQIVPDICPREVEFNGVVTDIKSMIAGVAASDPSAVEVTLFSGSGTASVESMLGSVVKDTDHLLVINQGPYGQRMLDIARTYKLVVTEYKPDPLSAIPMDDLDAVLANGNMTHLALVHHETSTGLLNDLRPISRLVKTHGLVCCLDAMSAFGAVPLDMTDMAIDFCAASSNKNIQGTAGISFVVSRKDSLAAIQNNPKRTVYLDLVNQTNYSNNHQQFQFTPPVQTVYALRDALQELLDEGVAERYQRYKGLWQQLNACFTAHGFTFVVDEGTHGQLITAYVIDDAMVFSFDHFHDYLFRKRITIYPGKVGALATFRVANIGALTPQDIGIVCQEIHGYFKRFPLGHPHQAQATRND